MGLVAPKSYLTTVVGAFHARVLEARLGAEGITVELRGIDEGPYPLPVPVHVLVEQGQLELAREILLGDAVDAALTVPEAPGRRPSRQARATRRWFRQRGGR